MDRRRLALALVIALAVLVADRLATLATDPDPIGPMPYTEAPNEQASLDALHQLQEDNRAEDVDEPE